MRRRAGLPALGVAIVMGLAFAAPAMAAPANIQAGQAPSNDVFNPSDYLHDGGTIATITWIAGGSHDVTSRGFGPDGKPLFQSALLSSGSAPVKGTQYLAQGTYAFYCTTHPLTMSGNLNVNTGSPLARPSVVLAGVKGTKLAKVVKKGKVPVKVTVANGAQATVAVLLGKKKVGSVTAPVAKSGTVQVPLTSKGKAALAKKTKATLKVTAAVDFGSPATFKLSLK
jgi:plastocyanin